MFRQEMICSQGFYLDGRKHRLRGPRLAVYQGWFTYLVCVPVNLRLGTQVEVRGQLSGVGLFSVCGFLVRLGSRLLYPLSHLITLKYNF